MEKFQESLYHKICEFQFDEPGCQRTFARRLASENGWSTTTAARAIVEYRRFILLAMVADHAVCPSDEVDEVWHLHLTYTRSYRTLCQEVLGRTLDHDPSQGGPTELAKHRRMYTQTLASYERVFGETSPTDLWPSVDERFRGDHRQKIDTSRYWLLPRPNMRSMATAIAQWLRGPQHRATSVQRQADLTRSSTYCFASCGLLFAASYAFLPLGVVNPLDMKGSDFLFFYLTLVMVGFLVAAAIRFWARRRDLAPLTAQPELDAYEIAYLAGGERRAINTAVATLARSENIELFAKSPLGFLQNLPATSGHHPVERATYAAFEGRFGASLQTAQLKAREALTPIRDRLRELGLVVSESSVAIGRVTPIVLMLVIIAIGCAKIYVGIARNKPVSILCVMVFATFAVTLFVFVRALHRTARGSRYLDDIRRNASTLQSQIERDPDSVTDPQLAMAIGLFGFGLLAAYPIPGLHDAFTQNRLGSGYSGGWGSGCAVGCAGAGGGCGGGGGGCGGGGCGGGGCGGCS